MLRRVRSSVLRLLIVFFHCQPGFEPLHVDFGPLDGQLLLLDGRLADTDLQLLLLDCLLRLQGADPLTNPLLLLGVGQLIAAVFGLGTRFGGCRHRHLKLSPLGFQPAPSIGQAKQLLLHGPLGLQQGQPLVEGGDLVVENLLLDVGQLSGLGQLLLFWNCSAITLFGFFIHLPCQRRKIDAAQADLVIGADFVGKFGGNIGLPRHDFLVAEPPGLALQPGGSLSGFNEGFRDNCTQPVAFLYKAIQGVVDFVEGVIAIVSPLLANQPEKQRNWPQHCRYQRRQ